MDNKETKKTAVPAARSMTMNEYEKFKAEGLDPAYYNEEQYGKYVQSITKTREWIIERIYGGNFSGDVLRGDLMRLANRTIELTNGAEDEIKN